MAVRGGVKEEVVKEAADLVFHCLVLLGVMGVELDEVLDELRARRVSKMVEEERGGA